MVHAGRGARLAQRPLAQLQPLVVGQSERQRDFLDRHVTAENLVAGQPDAAHAAGANRTTEPVAPHDADIFNGHTVTSLHPTVVSPWVPHSDLLKPPQDGTHFRSSIG
jgi:hypothetical protein